MTTRTQPTGPHQPGTPWPDPVPFPGGPTGPRRRTPIAVVALWLLAPGLIPLLGLAGGWLLTGWAG